MISCGLSWQKFLQRFEHTSPIHVCECDEIATECITCSCIWLCYLSWWGSLQCIPRSTYSKFWICSSSAKSLSVLVSYISTCIHTHPPHASWIPAVACCSALLQKGLSPTSCTSPLLSLYWNPNTRAWLLSHTGRSEPCMGADLVKSHKMAFLAGGIIAWNYNGSPRREHHKVPVQ